ncbi:MAG: sporulation initiation factor Spo0A C-terminal domain-containing protein [Acutalibacteraceae bacterium]|nr:sporulation initiation factor Spo0A C-terminal domain-containing protein [Acutalibacteraceae bacterium]
MVGDIRVLLTGRNDEETTNLVTSFRSNNMNVSVCGKNGAELLECIIEVEPDVVIMDDFLEQIDAIGVLTRLGALNPVKRPLIVVLSSTDNGSFQKSFLREGADYCFLKPVEAHLVVERVVQMLSWKGVGVFANANSSQELEIAVSEILHKVGIPAKHKGFRYLREAILLVIEYPEMINQVTTLLYPAIAENHNSNPLAVERTMRYAIGQAWKKGNIVLFKTYFGYAVKEPQKPSNSEFIARVSDDLRFKKKMHMQLDGPYVYVELF